MFVSRMGDVNQVFYEEIEKPEADGKNVLVKIHSVAICGTDKHAFMDGSMNGDIWGHEYSGEVVDPGSFEGLKVGDKVAVFPNHPCHKCEFCKAGVTNLCPTVFRGTGGSSAAAEYQLVAPYNVVKIDDNMTYDEGALIEPTTVTYHALKLSKIKPGQELLISGVGGLTGLLAEVARGYGVSKIVVTDAVEERAKPYVESGLIDAFVNCEEPGFYTKLMDLASSEFGYDAYIDIKGGVRNANEHIVCMKNGGTAVIVAEVPGDRGALNLYDLTEDEKAVTGSYGYTKDEFEEIAQMIADKKIDVTKHIGKKFKLSEGQAAFEHAMDRSVLPSKIIIEI